MSKIKVNGCKQIDYNDHFCGQDMVNGRFIIMFSMAIVILESIWIDVQSASDKNVAKLPA